MSLFFDFPINMRTDVERNFTVSGATETVNRTIADNNYETFSDSTDYAFITHGILPADRMDITHVFLKGSGITSYELSVPSGHGTGTTVTRTLPTTVNNLEGRPVSITVDGFQNDLFKIVDSGGTDNPFSATKVEIDITGTDVKVYEVMLLNLEYELQVGRDYFQINPSKVSRKAGLHENTSGGITRYSASNGSRDKWQIAYGVRFNQAYGYNNLLKFGEEHDNFCFAQEYTRYPDRVFPAVFSNFVWNITDKTDIIEHSMEVFFEIFES